MNRSTRNIIEARDSLPEHAFTGEDCYSEAQVYGLIAIAEAIRELAQAIRSRDNDHHR